MDRFCPPSLLQEWLGANEEAYKLRKDKKMITRTAITKQGVLLYCKKKVEDEFILVKPKKTKKVDENQSQDT